MRMSERNNIPINSIPNKSAFDKFRKDATPAELKGTLLTVPRGTDYNTMPNTPKGTYDKSPQDPPPGSSGVVAPKPLTQSYAAPELRRTTLDPHQQQHPRHPMYRNATLALSLATAVMGLFLVLSSSGTLTGAVIGAPETTNIWGITFLISGVAVLTARTWSHD